MTGYVISDDDWKIIEMLRVESRCTRDSPYYSALLRMTRSARWVLLDKLTSSRSRSR